MTRYDLKGAAGRGVIGIDEIELDMLEMNNADLKVDVDRLMSDLNDATNDRMRRAQHEAELEAENKELSKTLKHIYDDYWTKITGDDLYIIEQQLKTVETYFMEKGE